MEDVSSGKEDAKAAEQAATLNGSGRAASKGTNNNEADSKERQREGKDDGGLLVLDISKEIVKIEGEAEDSCESSSAEESKLTNDTGDGSADDIKSENVQIKVEKMDETGGTLSSLESKVDSMDTDMDMPPKQTLGKGKRARIPNKRYSDILLSPSNRSFSNRSFENGAELMPEEPVVKKVKTTGVDITHPKLKEPFKLGWKRELVYRADPIKKNLGDGEIYYYTPTGKKLKSCREILETIKNTSLTIENFTFLKEPIGMDPDYEIIRDAHQPSKLLRKSSNSKSKHPSKGGGQSPKVGASAIYQKISSPKLSKSGVSDALTDSKRNLGNFKIKAPVAKPKSDKNKLKESPVFEDVREIASHLSNKSHSSSAKKASSNRWPNRQRNSPRQPPHVGLTFPVHTPTQKEVANFMTNYLQNVSYGYSTLLYIFQYLKVQDLLRAGCVCTMWRDIANHPSLWRTVRMKNSQVHSFEGLANALKKHGTIHLDLRKMLLPSGGDDIWPQFSEAIKRVDTLRKIELCRCPAEVVEKLAISNPQLEVVNAVTIKCEKMSLESFSNLKELRELRIKSTQGLTLTKDIDDLIELKSLTHLSLTSIKDLNKLKLTVLAELTALESLDLGECTDFPAEFGQEVLLKLTNLEKLRFEKGQGSCQTCEILEAIKKMEKLEQLELVNFDIKAGFDKALGECGNLRKLLIIPTYISQSATTNHMVLGGVLRLQKTLTHFVWGVTLELLRVTELFIDQCEEKKNGKKKNGDSIPVLKPVPALTGSNTEISPALDPPQVEILALPSLQKHLLQSLPHTRVKILKIPFHATWRQSITDAVN